jgi:hypothetical protein
LVLLYGIREFKGVGHLSDKLCHGKNPRILWGKYARFGPGFPQTPPGKACKMPGFTDSRKIDIIALIAKIPEYIAQKRPPRSG